MAAYVHSKMSGGLAGGKGYQDLLDQILSKYKKTELKEALEAFLTSSLDERLSLVDAKSVLSFFAERIPKIGKDIVKDVCHFTLASIQPRIVSFEEQVL
ncbi:PREDICTED: COP9 signalosome complex subunit 4-like [Amphimedon queenslandica]|uniref:Uncharacterized protein n=1 Tax=Amphimedon queenslandica TaxID=400682 RepID=A0A1X7SIF9_AMPQE|nr:PREDICTED: COP9 signalosome complex subunit 4-like [Amphimedon queenslandica]|eukprot:XP_011409333.1 PREDICTED: COP9 signalosome complex subunit 4-like [Amphimedon queenslandica]